MSRCLLRSSNATTLTLAWQRCRHSHLEPLNPSTPTPLQPYNPTTPRPLHPHSPTTLQPLDPYTPTTLHPYTPTPLHPYTPTPPHPHTSTPLDHLGMFCTRILGLGQALNMFANEASGREAMRLGNCIDELIKYIRHGNLELQRAAIQACG